MAKVLSLNKYLMTKIRVQESWKSTKINIHQGEVRTDVISVHNLALSCRLDESRWEAPSTVITDTAEYKRTKAAKRPLWVSSCREATATEGLEK